jgi:hypothetical protein
VTVISRDLRCPADWPNRAAQEKGIDVVVLFSSDTDLAPALETVLTLRPGSPPACEVAAWSAPGGRPRSLAVRGASIRRHLLTEVEFRSATRCSMQSE